MRREREKRSDSHGEVGDEGRGRQVHLERCFLGDGQLVPHRALDAGHGVAGRHPTPHVVVGHRQLLTGSDRRRRVNL